MDAPRTRWPSAGEAWLPLALSGLLLAVGVVPALAGSGGLQGAGTDAGSSSPTLEELASSIGSVQAAEAALENGDGDGAEAKLALGEQRLDRAEHALARERGQLDQASTQALQRALAIVHDARAARAAEAAWHEEAERDRAALAGAADVVSQAGALRVADATLARGEQVVERHEQVHRQVAAFEREHPELADELGLGSMANAEAAQRVQAATEQRREQVGEQTARLAFTRTSEAQREAMTTADREHLAQLNPPRLREHFESFDQDDDGELELGEAKAFFDWVEEAIAYRHDDENATAEIAGTPVGDGRAGTDYQQSPLETFDERLGDCEDTSTLQVAFHRYWGTTAYQALLNTQATGGIDHAAAIVHVGDSPGALAPVQEGLHTYAFREGNQHGIRPGTYVIVDNTYSDTFGTVSGELEAGTFEVQAIETLADSIQRSDDGV